MILRALALIAFVSIALAASPIISPPGSMGGLNNNVKRAHVCKVVADYEQSGNFYFCTASCSTGEVGIAGWVETVSKATLKPKNGTAFPPYLSNGVYVVGAQLPASELASVFISATLICLSR